MAERERFVQFFQEADKNRDGHLTIDELANILFKYGYKGSLQEIRHIFQDADTDKDNKISMDEYLQAMGQVSSQEHELAILKLAFNELDQNGDGQINIKELASYFKQQGTKIKTKDLKKMVKTIDIDKNGKISFEEFAKYFCEK